MILPAGSTVITDTTASGGKAITMTARGTASGSVTLDQAASQLSVRAKSVSCGGAPQMIVKVDGAQVQTTSVTVGSWTEFTPVNVNLGIGAHTVTVDMASDAYTQTTGNSGKVKCRRSLSVDVTSFYAPDTTTGLVEKAQGKATGASSIGIDGYGHVLQPQYANDGTTASTADGSPSRWSSNNTDNQWWQVDLGSTTTVSRLDINWETAYASHYKIQGSTDGTNFIDLADVYNSQAGVKSTSFSEATTRYVRILGLTRGTQWGFSIWETKVYGSEAPVSNPVTVNMVSPVNGATVTGLQAVEAQASAANGVSRVEFYLDGTLNKTENIAPYCMAGDSGTAPCYGWDSTSVANGSHTIVAYAYDTSGAKSPASSVTFNVNNTNTGGGTTPSGEAMPVGDLPGWQQIFTDDFPTPVSLGNFPSNSWSNTDPRRSTYPGTKWSAYPYPWRDTKGQNQSDPTIGGWYNPEKTVSINNGMMDIWMHSESLDGAMKRLVAAPMPRINGPGSEDFGGQLYGRYAVRFRVDTSRTTNNFTGYKIAWLLWPKTNNWPTDGEIDFPEGDLRSNICGFMHWQGGTSGSSQYGTCTNATFPTWHTAVIEWGPTANRFILDGNVIQSSTDKIPNTMMRYVLQSETELGSTVPSADTQGHIQIDWFAAWKKL